MKISTLIKELANNLETVGDGTVKILIEGKLRDIYSVCYPSAEERRRFRACIEVKE